MHSGGTAVAVGKSRFGRGLFVTRLVRQGEELLVLRGRIRGYRYLLAHPGPIQDNAFRYGPLTYLSPEGELGDFVNHSCEPNARVVKEGRALMLRALVRIRVGSEVFIDYSTILAADDTWRMRCRCETPTCRRAIRSYTTLPAPLRESYLRRGIIPPYIVAIRG